MGARRVSRLLTRGPDRYARPDVREMAERLRTGEVGLDRRRLTSDERDDLTRRIVELVPDLCDRLDDAETLLGIP